MFRLVIALGRSRDDDDGRHDILRAELIAGLAFRYFTPLVRLFHAKGSG